MLLLHVIVFNSPPLKYVKSKLLTVIVTGKSKPGDSTAKPAILVKPERVNSKLPNANFPPIFKTGGGILLTLAGDIRSWEKARADVLNVQPL